MIPAWRLREIVESLNQAFNNRYPDEDIRMIGLLFAPPESKLGSSEIISSLEYFHHRSSDKIDFFCSGYRRYGKDKQFVVEKEVTNDKNPWYFNVLDFEGLRQEVEKNSAWKYSGESDLILLNARKSNSDKDVTLDWSSAICCDLETMKKDNAIESTRRFFEDIFHFVEEYEGKDPVSAFSDKQGVIKAKFGLKNLILSILPKKLRELYTEVQHLVVRDISSRQLPVYQLTELRRNGDFIVAIENLLRSTDEELPDDLNTEDLEDKLENFLSLSGIRLGLPLAENIRAINENPIIALRTAIVAVHLARISKEYDSKHEFDLNLLRRDILLGVTGIDQDLDEKKVKRCAHDYEKILYCLLGSLSDIASSAPDNLKPEAMKVYQRISRISFLK